MISLVIFLLSPRIKRICGCYKHRPPPFNIQILYILLNEVIYIFIMVVKINRNYFQKREQRSLNQYSDPAAGWMAEKSGLIPSGNRNVSFLRRV
jgi:hypothetical protein